MFQHRFPAPSSLERLIAMSLLPSGPTDWCQDVGVKVALMAGKLKRCRSTASAVHVQQHLHGWMKGYEGMKGLPIGWSRAFSDGFGTCLFYPFFAHHNAIVWALFQY